MKNIQHTKPTPFSQFPQEIWQIIFTYINDIKTISSFFILCKEASFLTPSIISRISMLNSKLDISNFLATLKILKTLHTAVNLPLAKLPNLTTLKELYICNNIMYEEKIKNLSHFTNLLRLGIKGYNINGEALIYLSCLTKIEYFLLDDNKNNSIQDIHLSHISNFTNLQSLNLNPRSGGIGNQGLKYISDLTNIIYLNLPMSNFSNEGAKHLSNLTNIRTLVINYNDNITAEALKNISHFTNITSFNLKYCSSIKQQGIQYLSNMTNLISLDISHLSSYFVGINGLSCITNLTNITQLNIESYTCVNDQQLPYLTSLTNIRTLNIKHTSVTEQGLEVLSSLTNLKGAR